MIRNENTPKIDVDVTSGQITVEKDGEKIIHEPLPLAARLPLVVFVFVNSRRLIASHSLNKTKMFLFNTKFCYFLRYVIVRLV
jgi:hypothetical protein